MNVVIQYLPMILHLAHCCRRQYDIPRHGRLVQADVQEVQDPQDGAQVPELTNITACSKVIRHGVMFNQDVIREELPADTKDDCAKLCKLRPYCKTFAFR